MIMKPTVIRILGFHFKRGRDKNLYFVYKTFNFPNIKPRPFILWDNTVLSNTHYAKIQIPITESLVKGTAHQSNGLWRNQGYFENSRWIIKMADLWYDPEVHFSRYTPKIKN